MLGVTSAGSGALIAVGLILLFRLSPQRVVGTDVFHAAILLWAAGLAHVTAGNVDFALAGTILLGSVPGVWLGSHWSVRVEPAVLRTTLAVVLIGAGLALLIKAGLDIPIAVIIPFPVAVIALLVVHNAAVARKAARRGGHMMVVMTPEATPAQIDAVVERLQAGGVHAKVMPGELTTAIGAIGDPEGVLRDGPRGAARRGPGDPDLAAVQARVERAVAPRADHVPASSITRSARRTPSPSLPDRARSSRASPDTRHSPRRGRGRCVDAARRGIQASHLTFLVPGTGH